MKKFSLAAMTFTAALLSGSSSAKADQACDKVFDEIWKFANNPHSHCEGGITIDFKFTSVSTNHHGNPDIQYTSWGEGQLTKPMIYHEGFWINDVPRYFSDRVAPNDWRQKFSATDPELIDLYINRSGVQLRIRQYGDTWTSLGAPTCTNNRMLFLNPDGGLSIITFGEKVCSHIH